MKWRRLWFIGLFLFFSTLLMSISAKNLYASEKLSSFDTQVKKWAMSCRDEVAGQLLLLIDSDRLTMGELFDTFYIPIPNTDPQKFHTQYDTYFDEILQNILDEYLKKDERILYVIAVDINGYVPTHNSKYSIPRTNNPEEDAKLNKTKRLLNDRSGLAAARNKKSFLRQLHRQDTGEKIIDLSVPIFIKEKHWGALRIGYQTE